jgi:hypothetical protein
MQHKVSWDIQDLVEQYETIMTDNPDKYEELTQSEQDQIWEDLSGYIKYAVDEHIGEVLHEIEYVLIDNLKPKEA